MARSSLNPLLLLLACGLFTANAAAPVQQGTQQSAPRLPVCMQPITLDAASSSLDLATKTYVFSEIVITQCALRLQADHARGTEPVNFSNSHWAFDGNVHIDAQDQGSLRSDAAVVEFRDNRITRATVTGKPAQFEQRRTDSDKVACGHADQIVYDVTAGTVRLSTDAWLSSGQDEISGSLLIYSMRDQKVQASTASATDQRIHIVISGNDAAKPVSGKTPCPTL
ncbi:MAG TPA: lipopolysaccharide transport periplasmic protein LptA [Steroidobacteraceae bacterium]|jgi:lipopolysaccharide export system protein LptA